MKKITVLIERGNDGTYGAYTLADMPYGVIGDGKTVADAIADFIGGYEDMKKYYSEEGKKFTEFEFEFKYDVPSFLQYYANAFSLAGLSHITGINQGQLSHYLTGHRNPSDRTIQKIQDRMHAFANELSNVHLV